MSVQATVHQAVPASFSRPLPTHGVVAALLLAGLLAWGLWLRLSGHDPLWMQSVHALPPSDAGVWAWSCLTILGLGWSLLILAMACDRRDGALISVLLPVFVVGAVLTHGMKGMIESVRPAASDLAGQLFFIGDPIFSANSTPSGHALTAAATATLLAWWSQKAFASVLLAAMALLVAWSRVVVGAHWPADVFVGMALGAGVVWAVLALAQWSVVSKRLLALRTHIASPAGQAVVAGLEIASALALVVTKTGYTHGWPAVAMLSGLAALSGLCRLRRVISLGGH